ncbi:hypothetical protein D6D13_05603, partial [Aureobasidium pullulans]
LPKELQDEITLRFHFVKESLEKITETYDSTIKKLKKTANHSVKMANDTTKIAIKRRKRDIARAANQKKQQAWLLSLYDDAIHYSGLNIVNSNRLDNRVSELYCKGSKQLN